MQGLASSPPTRISVVCAACRQPAGPMASALHTPYRACYSGGGGRRMASGFTGIPSPEPRQHQLSGAPFAAAAFSASKS